MTDFMNRKKLKITDVQVNGALKLEFKSYEVTMVVF